MNPQLDVGIVNFNGGSSLLACARSVLALADVDVRLFIFDNASTDNSLQLIESNGLPVSIIRSPQNLGYAAACNGLLQKFTAPIGVLSNMDLIFQSDWGREVCLHFQKSPQTGSVASLVLHADENTVNATGVRFFMDMHPKNEGSGKPRDQVDLREREVFGCYGAVMAFRMDLARQVGPLSEEFFLFYEETEWFWRWRLLGLRTVFVPTAVVIHQRSQVTVKHSLTKLYYPERNRVRSLVRLAPLVWIPVAMAISMVRFALQSRQGVPGHDASGRKQSKVAILLTILRAWKDGLGHLGEDLSIRRRYYRNSQRSPWGVLADCKKYALACKDL